MSKLKVIVMTQNDRFFIPTNIRKASEVCDIVEIVQVNCKSSLDNKLSDYLNWFGFLQCAKMGFKTIVRIVKDILDKLSGYRMYRGNCSVKSVAGAIKATYSIISDSNEENFVNHIENLSPDLIISYSAPQIIKERLLNIPKHGVINVHGSLLPDYRGCFPSFWYLYNGEKTGGATVHYMSAKIDDGGIIKQGSVDISDCKTMFELMSKTKQLGGELMVQAIEDIALDKVNAIPNDTTQGRYFTWPTLEQTKDFRAKGLKLV